ncbi:hypothetical protein N9Q05_00540 [bacterium]|nr:hypothetical protein [bacterium]
MRVSLVVHVFAVFVLWHSAASALVAMSLTCFLCVSMMRIMRNNVPVCGYHTLSYHKNFWQLQDKQGKTIKYEHASIRVDTGFFLLLTLKTGHLRKTILMFNDQLSTLEYRMLYLIEKTAEISK